MPLSIGSLAPNFRGESTQGEIDFHNWVGDSWCILFAHPKAFTSVCTSELGAVARLEPEFAKRNTKIISLSVDTQHSYGKWMQDIEQTQGYRPSFPMISDPDLHISKAYGMLPASAQGPAGTRNANANMTVRNIFIIAPDKTIQMIQVYPLLVGRNFDEVLRCLDALQLTERHPVATPANWKRGDDVLVGPDMSDAEIARRFGDTTQKLNSYISFVPDPEA